MSRVGTDFLDSATKHERHLDKVRDKQWAVEGKQALLDYWEKAYLEGKCDHEYLLGLRKRVRSLRVQLLAMRPVEKGGESYYE